MTTKIEKMKKERAIKRQDKVKEKYIAKSKEEKRQSDYAGYGHQTYNIELEKETKKAKAKPHITERSLISAALKTAIGKADSSTYSKNYTKLEKKDYPKIGKDY